MRVGLLGAVEVWHDEQPIPLGPPMQRAVLALLALDPGHEISVERIADWLWDVEPPAGARGLVQTYISRLRAAVQVAGGVIDRGRAGYRLMTPPATVDVHEFRRLVAAGRLSQGLSLWRGEPLADLPPTTAVLATRTRLAEEHLAAVEEHLEGELHIGRHRELVGELAALTARHPLRERPVRLLMLALHRSGRQAEALAAYDAARRRWAAELGLDPGAELADLQARILRDDPGLAVPTAGGHRSAPRQLPYDLRDFTGRGAEIATLLGVADAAEHTMAIVELAGMPGVGKTCLAVHVAHSVADRFPDGQVFLDLHGFTPDRTPLDPCAALAVLLRGIGLPTRSIPEFLDERAALWRSELANRRMVVVLDNAVDTAQIRPLLPGLPGSLVLITSRRALPGLDCAVSVPLDVLTSAEAVALFGAIVGPRAAEEPVATAEVAGLCGLLPLAIRIAAAKIRSRPQWTFGGFAERLGTHRRRLAELTAADRDVSASFTLSYADLASDRQRMFRLLGVHPGVDFDLLAAAALADVPLPVAERLLDDLLDAHLLQQCRSGRFGFHDLLRAYAGHRAETEDPAEIRAGALVRLLRHYQHAAMIAMDHYDPLDKGRRPAADAVSAFHLTDRRQATEWLDAERANLIAVACQVPDDGRAAAWMSRTIARYLDTASHHLDAEALHGHAARSASGQDRAEALRHLGTTHWRMGKTEQAVENLRSALAITREIGDRDGECRCRIGLGIVFDTIGAYDSAIASLDEALLIAEEIGDRVGAGRVLSNLAIVYRRQGRPADSMATQLEALAVFRELGHRDAEAQARHNLGNVCRDLGWFAEAVEHHDAAAEIAGETGNRALVANAQDGLARVSAALGETAAARRLWQVSLAGYTELRAPEADGVRRSLAQLDA